MPKRPIHIVTAMLALLLSACATLDGPTEPHDPWERFNRSMFKFNDKVDRAVLKPVAKGYRAVTPNFVEKGVSNFFSNLGEIKTIANDLLQFKIARMFSAIGRIIINSTIGIGGLFDVAKHMGLEKHEEDFGQTLGRWGVKSGPYLVLPFLGPSSARDGAGLAGDSQFNPIREVEHRETRMALYAMDIISMRADLLEAGEIVDEAAFDPYIFIREAYLQRRRNQVHDGAPPVEEADSEEEIDIFSDD